MDNVDDRGDLGDVVRAGGSTTAPPAGAGTLRGVLFDAAWSQLPPEPAGFPPTWGASVMDDFGDPFCSFEEYPLLHELAGALMSFDDSSKPAVSGLIEMVTPAGNDGGGGSAATAGSSGGSPAVRQKAVTAGGEVMKRPSCGFFSDEAAAASMAVSPRGIRPTRAVFCAGDMAVKVNAGSAAGAPDEGGLHMPSTRILGIKSRRKGALQEKKEVVSIPAPAAAGGKPGGGEAVPPDLWAWRKYGQKPIKGSPYPRSYYRCSSSKGCPARKQVERSRTDAGMLVISYTSGHNHPWPTHRNALAGTTRTSQQPAAKNSPSAAPLTSSSHDQANLPSTAENESKEGACRSQANHGRQHYFSRRERSSTIEGTGDEEEVRWPPPAEGMFERPVHSYRQIDHVTTQEFDTRKSSEYPTLGPPPTDPKTRKGYKTCLVRYTTSSNN